MYTLSECQKLKEIGFPMREHRTEKRNGIMTVTEYFQPSIEILLDLIRHKLDEHDKTICIFMDRRIVININEDIKIGSFNTLSEAVYALAIWAHDNKLLEGK